MKSWHLIHYINIEENVTLNPRYRIIYIIIVPVLDQIYII